VPSRPDWLLVDGSSLIFRAYFGVPNTIRAPDGRLVNGVRGFLDMLARLARAVGIAPADLLTPPPPRKR